MSGIISDNVGRGSGLVKSAGGGKTLVAPTMIVNDTAEVSASQSGTALPSTGTTYFYYPIGALLSGTFAKTSATSVLGVAYQYSIENNTSNQHDTYLWAGTGVTLGTAGDNFRYHIGDDENRQHNDEQYSGRTIYITGMSAATHTINVAAGTYADRTHTYYYCSAQQHGDRSAAPTPSTMWCWEIEV